MQMLLVLKNKEMEKVPGKSWHLPALPIRGQLFPAGGSKGDSDLSVSWSRALSWPRRVWSLLCPRCAKTVLPETKVWDSDESGAYIFLRGPEMLS